MAIKLNGNYPGNPAANGLPTVQGVIYLADATNGRPLALMDSIEITINRTGAATTLAARHLARPNSSVATICGAGVQGRIQAGRSLRRRTRARSMSGISGHDAAEAFAQRTHAGAQDRCAAERRSRGDARERHHRHRTSSRTAFLTPDLVRPGTFISAVGADNSDKIGDPSAALCAKPRRSSIRWSRRPRSAICIMRSTAGAVAPTHVHATLGRTHRRREARPHATTSAITLFDSTGMGLQDVAAAAAVYRRALATGAGTSFTIN